MNKTYMCIPQVLYEDLQQMYKTFLNPGFIQVFQLQTFSFDAKYLHLGLEQLQLLKNIKVTILH